MRKKYKQELQRVLLAKTCIKQKLNTGMSSSKKMDGTFASVAQNISTKMPWYIYNLVHPMRNSFRRPCSFIHSVVELISLKIIFYASIINEKSNLYIDIWNSSSQDVFRRALLKSRFYISLIDVAQNLMFIISYYIYFKLLMILLSI